jgi:arginine decarboxylase
MMKKIKRIGVVLKEGCDIDGGQYAMDVINQTINLDTVVKVNLDLVKKQNPLYLDAVVDLNRRLSSVVRKAHQEGFFPLIFGGDHALAIGSISASEKEELAILWIDAHGDCNTEESSDSKRIHGMPLAVLQGYGHKDLIDCVKHTVKSKNIMLVGIRSLDVEEEKLMTLWNVHWITMDEIRKQGIDWMNDQVNRFIQDKKHLHVSFDCDSMDPSLFPGVNTPVIDGFKPYEILPLIKHVLNHPGICSMDIVEFNPTRDQGSTLDLIKTINQLVSETIEE